MIKKFFIIIFLTNLILFWNVTKVNRINLKFKNATCNQVILKYSKHKKNNEIVQTIDKNDETIKIKLSSNLNEFKLYTQPAISKFEIKEITILSTLFPFSISAKKLPEYFNFIDVSYSYDNIDKYAKIEFNSNSNHSFISTKTVVWYYIYLIRFGLVVFLSLLLTFLLFVIYKLKRFMPILLLIFVFVCPFFFSLINFGHFFELNGAIKKHCCPKFSIDTFNDKSFQREFESYIDYKLTWNNLYIKMFNTVFYFLFDKSYSFNEDMIIGKNKYLYSKDYIDRLTENEKINQSQINKLSSDLRSIQDYYKKQNKVFIVVITPNKVEFYPDYVPKRFNIRPNFQQKFYTTAVKSFKREGINLVDTPEYLKENSKNHIIFVQKGLHWADYSKYLATKLLVKKINELIKEPIGTIVINKIKMDDKPQGQDTDLADLLNLLKAPYDYPVEHVQLKPNQKTSNLKVNIVGGSFSYGLIDMLNNARLFNSIELFYYLTTDRMVFKNFQRKFEMSSDKKDMTELINNINKGNIIILEMNQEVMADTKITHIQKYINLMKKCSIKKTLGRFDET